MLLSADGAEYDFIWSTFDHDNENQVYHKTYSGLHDVSAPLILIRDFFTNSLIGGGVGGTINGQDERNDIHRPYGDDRISGGNGSDILKGGKGSDMFVFSNRGDRIDDFNDRSDPHMQQVDDDVIINDLSENTMNLKNFLLSGRVAADCLLRLGSLQIRAKNCFE